MVFRKMHSTQVISVLNLVTVSIFTQYHVVYDNMLSDGGIIKAADQ